MSVPGHAPTYAPTMVVVSNWADRLVGTAFPKIVAVTFSYCSYSGESNTERSRPSVSSETANSSQATPKAFKSTVSATIALVFLPPPTELATDLVVRLGVKGSWPGRTPRAPSISLSNGGANFLSRPAQNDLILPRATNS